MKNLFIIRHAKSNWDNPALSDFDRPLNHRGKSDAPMMAERLIEKGFKPDLIVSSPANRALTTAHYFADALQYSRDLIEIEASLYEASVHDWFALVNRLPEHIQNVMIFGHNPAITYFTKSLCNCRIDNIPTCGMALCKITADKWADVKENSAELSWFNYPKLI